MNILIEEIKNDEIEIAIQLLKELYIELGEEEESVEFLDKNLIVQMTASGITEIYLAKTDNQKVVGIMTLTENQAIYAGGKFGSLDEMYIKPEFRSKNIGAQFIERMKEIGAERNWKRVDVTAPTEERWVRTVEFYKKSGFVFTGPKLKLRI